MTMQHKNMLASDLIRAHFGELVEQVCQFLLHNGPAALGEIARSTSMNLSQLRDSLLVLVQHNCIQGYKVKHEAAVGQGVAKIPTSYLAIIDNMLHRIRFPKFLVIVREELDEEAESLMEGLLEHGRLTLEQVIQRAAARQGKAEADIEMLQKQTFAALVRSRYIERCPAPEPIITPKVSEPPKKGPRGKGKSVKAAFESLEARVLTAAAGEVSERFRMPSSLEEVGETAGVNEPVEESVTAAHKRKRHGLAMDAKTMAVIEEKEVLWRANYEELIRKLRHQACVKQVKERIDSAAGTVLEAMLKSIRTRETTAQHETVSVPLPMTLIMEAVTRSPAGGNMSMERIRGTLHQMSTESLGYLSRTGDAGSSYIINIHKLIAHARQNEVEAIVLQRFGRESCRIFRLLMMKGQMEQKQIAGMAMVQLKSARELLYRLLKEQYVIVQEVAKTAEHAALKSFYVWNINWQSIQVLVADSMYHAAANLGQRLQHEVDQEQEVLELVNVMHAAKVPGTQSHVTLTQHQHDQVKRINGLASVLESSLLQLDNSILLFNDF